MPPQVPASRLEPYACAMVQWLLFAHEGTLLTWENALINFFRACFVWPRRICSMKMTLLARCIEVMFQNKWYTPQRTLFSYGCTQDVF